jgi:hypothetical protein
MKTIETLNSTVTAKTVALYGYNRVVGNYRVKALIPVDQSLGLTRELYIQYCLTNVDNTFAEWLQGQNASILTNECYAEIVPNTMQGKGVTEFLLANN